MEFEKIINERYSVRKFEDKHLEKKVIEEIIKAGHLAPTGCNFQPQRILVLNSDKSREKLKNCTKCHFDAPCAMIVCYNKNETWHRPYDGVLSAPVDASIVTTYMMLKAWELGVGTCWVMHFNPQKTKEEFNIPENVEPVAILTMGYPHKDAYPLDLHSKFRPLEEVVFYENF